MSTEKSFPIRQFETNSKEDRDDLVAIEEPLEIRISFMRESKRVMQQVSITMRTPGNDTELAAGFLYTEGILTAPEQINEINVSGVDGQGNPTNNIVRVNVGDDVSLDPQRLRRNFISNSSCGVCGKSSLDSLEVKQITKLDPASPTVPASIIYGLPRSLRETQTVFEKTGGIHAAGIADIDGAMLEISEDIGRHNAVDKLIGGLFQKGELPASNKIIVVSGRASFEIVQKAIVAGIPMMVAVGAPSSLAVELATKYKMTLVGFTSNSRFNVYSVPDRLVD